MLKLLLLGKVKVTVCMNLDLLEKALRYVVRSITNLLFLVQYYVDMYTDFRIIEYSV